MTTSEITISYISWTLFQISLLHTDRSKEGEENRVCKRERQREREREGKRTYILKRKNKHLRKQDYSTCVIQIKHSFNLFKFN